MGKFEISLAASLTLLSSAAAVSSFFKMLWSFLENGGLTTGERSPFFTQALASGRFNHKCLCSAFLLYLRKLTQTLSVCCTDLITEHATRDVMMGNSLSRSQEKHDSPSSTAVLSLRISGRSRMKRECAVDTRLSHNVVIIDVHTDTHHGETLVLRAGRCDYQKSNRPLDKVEEEEDEGG